MTNKLELTDIDFQIIEQRVQREAYADNNPGMRIGEAWVKRVQEELGDTASDAIAAKIEKYRAEYQEEKLLYGDEYLNANQRQQRRQAALLVREQQVIASRDALAAKAQESFALAVAAEVAKVLNREQP